MSPIDSIRIALLLLLAAPIAAAAESQGVMAAPCERCDVEEGYYRAAAPPDWDGKSPLPLVVYFHAWGKSPESVISARNLVGQLHQRGALVVAPFAEIGFWRQLGEGRAEQGRDEAAYVRRILADVKRRWPIDERRMLATGFSRGASMVWNIACYEGGLFTAYAPFGGAFWHSTPRACPSGPQALRHLHGLKDPIVGYDKVGKYDSSPVTEGVALFRRMNGAAAAPSRTLVGKVSCERWEGEKPVELCVHSGGHWYPPNWLGKAYDWMIGLVGEQ